jgi:hypothetical protein
MVWLSILDKLIITTKLQRILTRLIRSRIKLIHPNRTVQRQKQEWRKAPVRLIAVYKCKPVKMLFILMGIKERKCKLKRDPVMVQEMTRMMNQLTSRVITWCAINSPMAMAIPGRPRRLRVVGLSILDKLIITEKLQRILMGMSCGWRRLICPN